MTLKLQPRKEQLDLNRNFPAGWRQEHEQFGAGPFPTSEPEVRAAAELRGRHTPTSPARCCSTPTAACCCGPTRTRPTTSLPVEDLLDLPEDRREGHRADRLSEHLGVPRLPLSPQGGHHRLVRRLGVRPSRRVRLDGGDLEPAARGRHHATTSSSSGIASIRSRTTSSCSHGTTRRSAARGFVDWYPFRPSAAGRGRARRLGHALHVEQSAARAARAGARAFPEVARVASAGLAEAGAARSRRDALGPDTWRVRLVVHNTGWLPSYVTKRAVANKRVRGVVARDRAAGGRVARDRPRARGARPARRPRLQASGAEQLGRMERRRDRRPRQGRMGGARSGGRDGEAHRATRARRGGAGGGRARMIPRGGSCSV